MELKAAEGRKRPSRWDRRAEELKVLSHSMLGTGTRNREDCY